MEDTMLSVLWYTIVSPDPIHENNQEGLTHCMFILIAKVIMQRVGVTCSLACQLPHFFMARC